MFADPDFDGDPEMIKRAGEGDDDLTGSEDDIEPEDASIDELDGTEVDWPEPEDKISSHNWRRRYN